MTVAWTNNYLFYQIIASDIGKINWKRMEIFVKENIYRKYDWNYDT